MISPFEFTTDELEEWFPNIIGKNYKIFPIKEIDKNYNCVAFSLDIYDDFFWFNEENWPPQLRFFCFKNFISFFKLYKYEECGVDGNFENGYDKIAIYAVPYKLEKSPTHVSKQFGNSWRSKIGNKNILEHELEWISGLHNKETSYGEVELFMRRKR